MLAALPASIKIGNFEMKKKLKFTSNGVHIGIEDFGFIWKQNDEHEVDAAVAKLAVETFPTLFTIVGNVDDTPSDSDSETETEVDNKKLDTQPKRSRGKNN